MSPGAAHGSFECRSTRWEFMIDELGESLERCVSPRARTTAAYKTASPPDLWTRSFLPREILWSNRVVWCRFTWLAFSARYRADISFSFWKYEMCVELLIEIYFYNAKRLCIVTNFISHSLHIYFHMDVKRDIIPIDTNLISSIYEEHINALTRKWHVLEITLRWLPIILSLKFNVNIMCNTANIPLIADNHNRETQ